MQAMQARTILQVPPGMRVRALVARAIALNELQVEVPVVLVTGGSLECAGYVGGADQHDQALPRDDTFL